MKNYLIAGVCLGILAIVLVELYVSQAIESFQEDPGAVKLVKFVQDVQPNRKFSPEMVEIVRLPDGYQEALQGTVKPGELPVVIDKVIPRGAKTGQFLLWSMFKQDEGRPELIQNVIPVGMRVVPIPLDKYSGAGGWIQPGDTVDLVGTFSRAGAVGEQTQETWVFLEKVKVVATGGRTGYMKSIEEGGPREYGDISVLVTPANALKIVYALEHSSTIRALLRNPQDTQSLAGADQGINQAGFEKLRPRAVSGLLPVAAEAGQ